MRGRPRASVLFCVLLLSFFSEAHAAPKPHEQDVGRLLDMFGRAFQMIRKNYVKPLSDQELIQNAIRGMVLSLDPHSSFLGRQTFSDVRATTKGEFAGVGLELTEDRSGYPRVVSPIAGTPAEKAGIKTGDFVTHVNGVHVRGMPLETVLSKIRGPQTSSVTLSLHRPKTKKTFTLTLVRKQVKALSVHFQLLNHIGEITITSFNESTEQQLIQAIKTLQTKFGPSLLGYVLDLRNNPGGLLVQAVAVADTFLQQGEIVLTRGRDPNNAQRFDASDGDMIHNAPLVVLVNTGTASAAEIVAGALQDHRRALIVGEPTFGKGSVQTIFPLGSFGDAIKITTQLYYTPSGRSIQEKGIVPDVVIASTPPPPPQKTLREKDLHGALKGETLVDVSPTVTNKEHDRQLSVALSILKGLATMRLPPS